MVHRHRPLAHRQAAVASGARRRENVWRAATVLIVESTTREYLRGVL